MTPRPLAECDEALSVRYDAALLDLDGVVYVGADAVPGAADAVRGARRAGMRIAFVTNNASRSPEDVADQLNLLGITADPGEVATSAQAAARVLSDRVEPGGAVLVVGGPGLVAAVTAAGFRVVHSADDAPAAVVQGYSAETAYRDLAEATLALRAGALWVVANRDATMPSVRGQVPGNGALVAAVAVATGRQPLVAGKPECALHLESVARVGARRPLVVGDRLDTDIAGANAAGCDSLLVLTGVTDVESLCAAVAIERPTYLSADLRGLLVKHSGAVVRDGVATCGRHVATWQDGEVVVATSGETDGDDDGLDAIRVRVALTWHRADAAGS
ncbi:MAG TPA: HAD-IIA family hydrolase [Mycobacteriales bacterium]|nr:HAD-IIA family hydrolase [Mycobacteriales bacterium]